MKPYIVFEADKLSAKELERRLNWFEANNYEVFEHGYDRGRFVMKHYEPPPPPPRMLSKQEREELGNKIVNWAHEKEIKLAKRHIIYYLTLALTAWLVSGRRIGLLVLVAGVVVALGVGVSRIYLGYHYLTDVVGGLLAGIAWLLVVGAAFRARPTWRQWRSERIPRTRERGGSGTTAVG